MRKRLIFESLEARRQMAAGWTNAWNSMDVNDSGQVTPLDALLVINHINQQGIGVLPSTSDAQPAAPLVDVNSDGAVGPRDVIRIINALNHYTQPPEFSFANASTTEAGSQFTGRTTPDTTVVIEQLTAVLPMRWTLVSDPAGVLEPFDIGAQSIIVRVTATDPLGRIARQNLEFTPAQPAPVLSALSDTLGPAIGTLAPEVKLLNQNGQQVSLQEKLQTGNVVLYFYPKDNTPKCTIEAQDFRNRSAELQALGATVLGVSIDPVESHLEFANKYDLNFDILADDSHSASAAYGVLTQLNGKSVAARTTFIIGSDGKVLEVFRDVDVTVHGQRVVDALKNLSST